MCSVWSLAIILLKWVDFSELGGICQAREWALGIKGTDVFAGDQATRLVIKAPTHFLRRSLGCRRRQPWRAMNETVQRETEDKCGLEDVLDAEQSPAP